MDIEENKCQNAEIMDFETEGNIKPRRVSSEKLYLMDRFEVITLKVFIHPLLQSLALTAISRRGS